MPISIFKINNLELAKKNEQKIVGVGVKLYRENVQNSKILVNFWLFLGYFSTKSIVMVSYLYYYIKRILQYFFWVFSLVFAQFPQKFSSEFSPNGHKKTFRLIEFSPNILRLVKI